MTSHLRRSAWNLSSSAASLLLTSSPVRAVASTSAPPAARRAKTPRNAGSPATGAARRAPAGRARTARPSCRASPARRAPRAGSPAGRAPARRARRGRRLQLVLEHLGDRVGALGELVVLADLGGLLDAVALQAGELEPLRQLAVVLLRRRLQDGAHVAGVVLPQLQRIRDRQLGIDDRPARQRQQHAEALIGAARPLRRQHVQVLRQDLGARDPPVVLGLGARDRLLATAPARSAICDCRYCQIDVATRPATPITKLERKP